MEINVTKAAYSTEYLTIARSKLGATYDNQGLSESESSSYFAGSSNFVLEAIEVFSIVNQN